MNLIRRILENTEAILAAAIIISLIIPVETFNVKHITEICLGIIMFFSLRPFMGKKFQPKNSINIAIPIIISYGILSIAYLVMGAAFFGMSHDFFIGYMLIALTPPAVSIIPFCYISRCKPETADLPVFISFILTIFLVPTALYLLYGKSIDLQELMKIIVIILLIPMFLAYKTSQSKSKIFDYSKAIINIGLAAVIAISISMNRSVFLDITNKDVLYVYFINTIIIFGLGFLVYKISKHINPEERYSYSFFASQKNVATAIALGIVLFNPDTAVPAIIALALQFIYFIFFERLFVMRNMRPKKKKVNKEKKKLS